MTYTVEEDSESGGRQADEAAAHGAPTLWLKALRAIEQGRLELRLIVSLTLLLLHGLVNLALALTPWHLQRVRPGTLALAAVGRAGIVRMAVSLLGRPHWFIWFTLSAYLFSQAGFLVSSEIPESFSSQPGATVPVASAPLASPMISARSPAPRAPLATHARESALVPITKSE